MKKVVIFAIIVLLIAGGIWYWYSRPLSQKEFAVKVCSDDSQDLTFLLESIQDSSSKACSKIVHPNLNAYCFAYSGLDHCSGMSDESQKSCRAVLARNPSECADDMCRGILGDVSVSDPTFGALARRDMSALTDPAICQGILLKASSLEECKKNAKSVAQYDACLNQSSPTV